LLFLSSGKTILNTWTNKVWHTLISDYSESNISRWLYCFVNNNWNCYSNKQKHVNISYLLLNEDKYKFILWNSNSSRILPCWNIWNNIINSLVILKLNNVSECFQSISKIHIMIRTNQTNANPCRLHSWTELSKQQMYSNQHTTSNSTLCNC